MLHSRASKSCSSSARTRLTKHCSIGFGNWTWNRGKKKNWSFGFGYAIDRCLQRRDVLFWQRYNERGWEWEVGREGWRDGEQESPIKIKSTRFYRRVHLPKSFSLLWIEIVRPGLGLKSRKKSTRWTIEIFAFFFLFSILAFALSISSGYYLCSSWSQINSHIWNGRQ